MSATKEAEIGGPWVQEIGRETKLNNIKRHHKKNKGSLWNKKKNENILFKNFIQLYDKISTSVTSIFLKFPKIPPQGKEWKS